jgi:hypothetical protein
MSLRAHVGICHQLFLGCKGSPTKPIRGSGGGIGQDGKSTLDPKRVQTHVRFCSETLQTAVVIHEAAKREEDRNIAKREEQRQRLKVSLPATSARPVLKRHFVLKRREGGTNECQVRCPSLVASVRVLGVCVCVRARACRRRRRCAWRMSSACVRRRR